MKDNKSASLFQKEQVMESLKQSFVKLNPRVMIKNPIMFTVEVVTVVMLKLVVRPKLTVCVKPVKRLLLKCWLTVKSIPLAVHV